MRKWIAFLVLLGVLGAGLAQLTIALADTTTLSCSGLVSEEGASFKSPGGMAYTVDLNGYCYSYYLYSTIVNNGQESVWPDGGWASSQRIVTFASGTTAVSSMHNTYRDWYNGYVGTNDN